METLDQPVQNNDNPYAACYNCGEKQGAPVGMTWWGGILGPKMMKHVKCGACGTKYNGNTGRSNNGKIAVYVVVTTVIAVGVAIAIAQM